MIFLLIVIPNNKDNIENLLNKNCDVLIGVEGYSVNTLNMDIKEITELNKKYKNIFISINRNIENSEIDNLKELLIRVSKLNIKGIFYYDVALVNLNKKLNLNLNLVWSSEHLTTNFNTINYWYDKGITSTFISNEITLNEMLDISDNTKSNLIVQLFGFIPMYVSKRKAINNYLNYFNKERKETDYYLFKEDKKYSIVDNKYGTMIYSNFILNGLKESLILKDKVSYILINGYKINNDNLDLVIDSFNNIDDNNQDELDEKLVKTFDNLEKGFLYEESIYTVKKDA